MIYTSSGRETKNGHYSINHTKCGRDIQRSYLVSYNFLTYHHRYIPVYIMKYEISWAMRRKYIFYRVGLSIGISTLLNLEGFFFFERFLRGSASTPLALRSPCLPRRERVRGLRDKREVGTILDFGWHARAFFRTLPGGVVVRKYKWVTS